MWQSEPLLVFRMTMAVSMSPALPILGSTRLLAQQPAGEIEVMDHHVPEQAAGDLDVFQRRRAGIAAGDDDQFDLAHLALADRRLERAVGGVEATVEADGHGHAMLLQVGEAAVDPLDVEIDRLFACVPRP